MKFSVVIPSFNDIRILETIQSIKNQTYPQLELPKCCEKHAAFIKKPCRDKV